MRNIAISEALETALNVDVVLEEEAKKETANTVGCTIVPSNLLLRGKLLSQSVCKLYHKSYFAHEL